MFSGLTVWYQTGNHYIIPQGRPPLLVPAILSCLYFLVQLNISEFFPVSSGIILVQYIFWQSYSRDFLGIASDITRKPEKWGVCFPVLTLKNTTVRDLFRNYFTPHENLIIICLSFYSTRLSKLHLHVKVSRTS